MTRLVIDASIAVKWLFPEPHAAASRRTLTEDNELLAPDLIWAEVGNAIWKRWLRREVKAETVRHLLKDLQGFPLEIHASDVLLSAAWDIAERYRRSLYDSLYLALAITQSCRLGTADKKLFNALKDGPLASHLCWVEDIP